MADLLDNGLNRKIADGAAVAREADALEAEIAELRQQYEQFFLGLERRPPTLQHQALKKKLRNLKGAFVRQTAIKFRINAVQQKFISYERLWTRTLSEIENGTYRRDLFKAKLHQKKAQEKPQEDAAQREAARGGHSLDDLAEAEIETSLADVVAEATQARPQPAPTKPVGVAPAAPGVQLRVTPSPQPAVRASTASAPAAAGAPSALSEQKLRAVYDAYVTAKKRCHEDTSKLNFDQVAANLRKQVPELMKKSGAKSVEFKIVIKDGKAVLRAVPK